MTRRSLVQTAWLFSRARDFLLVAIPVALTLCGLVSASLLAPGEVPLVKRQALWLSQFLAGNTTHVILTFVLLLFRRDVLDATPGQARRTLAASSSAFVAAFALFWVTRQTLPWFLPLGTAVAICFATHHTLSQARGFWALYSLRTRSLGGLPVGEAERRLFQVFVPLGLVLILTRWFFVPASPGARFAFFPVAADLPAPLPASAATLMLVAWAAYALALLAALRPLRQGRTGAMKVAHVACHVAGIGLSLAAPLWGAVFLGSLHGIEYILLCHRMLGRSSAAEAGLPDRWVVPAMVASMLPLALVGLASAPFLPPVAASHRQSVDIALILLNSLVIAHYAADACIYRFRDPAVRAVALRRMRFA